MKRWLLVPFMVLSLVVVACGGGVSPDGVDSGDYVKVGLMTPMTGDAASYGEVIRNATEDYLKANPEWGGKEVKLIVEDSKCNPQEGASAAQKMLAINQIDILISSECSGATLAAVPVAEEAKTLIFSGLSTSPELSGSSQYFFRTAPSDKLGGQVMSEALEADGRKKIALIVENTDFATVFADRVEETFSGEVVLKENYNSGVTDFKTQLQKAVEAGADAVMHSNQTPVSAGFLAKQNAELGLNLPLYSTDATLGSEFFEIAKNAAEGQVVVVTAADTSKPEVKKTIENYIATHGPTSNEAFMILQLDAVGILHQAVEAVGAETEALVDYLKNMEAYQGMSGEIVFDENGDSNIKPSAMVAVDGEFVIKK